VKNFFLVLIKNDDLLGLLRDMPWWLPRQVAILGYLLLFEHESLAAYRFLFRHRRDILAARRKIEQLRSVTRQEIRAWYGRAFE
jgi:hypothetical protein